MKTLQKISLLVTLLILSQHSFGTEAELNGEFKPQPLDGVQVEAIEAQMSPTPNELGVDVSLFPFDEFYDGVGVHLNYTHHFTETLGWEVANLGYIFPVQSSVTTDLADNFKATPQSIESLRFSLSTSALITLIYGKLIFAKNYIRYVDGGFLAGVGLLGTSLKNRLAGNVGFKLNLHVNNLFSWNIGIRDQITYNKGVNNDVAFTLGTSVSF